MTDAITAGRLVEVEVAELDLRRVLRGVWSGDHLDPRAKALLNALP